MKKDISKKNSRKILLIVLLISFLFFIGLEIYYIYLDRYNFREFEKAKVILDTIEKGTVKFSNINEFNEVYDTNIKPIKNCYMINSSNGKYSYIFGFKFESLFYMLKYQSWYFVYPGYDRLYFSICLMGVGCYDGNFDDFKYIIKKPCK